MQPPPDQPTDWQDGRPMKAIAVLDIVESVRLVAKYETDVIARWRALVTALTGQLLPRFGGTLVSHRGDGAILAFDAVPDAVQTLLECRRLLDDGNQTRDADARIVLRCGVHFCAVLLDGIDAFGAGVNIVARLTAQARPGEILITAEANDQLHPALDIEAEDLGDLWLKHLEQPVRAYRLAGAHGAAPVPKPPPLRDDVLQPCIAILPFKMSGAAPGRLAIGELIADELICALSQHAGLQVVSRLSTRVLAGRNTAPPAVAAALTADYVVTGNCSVLGERVLVHTELYGQRQTELLQTWRHTVDVQSLLADESPLIETLVADIGARLLQRQIDLVSRSALQNLAAYSLLLGGIALMHRLSRNDVMRSYALLDHLSERWPGHAAPHAWKARWHLFSVIQGFSSDAARDRRAAFDCSARALDINPASSVALAVAGSVRIGLSQDVDGGIEHYKAALQNNPSDPFAWMLLGTAHAFKGEGFDATSASARAVRLSPLDPMHFLYDCHAAAAALAAEDNERALQLAERSLRANAQHLSTLRVLAIAQMLASQPDSAQASVRQLRALDPKASVDGFLRSSASAAYPIGRRFATLLAEAGLPQSAP